MPSVVPDAPSAIDLASHAVGRPVSAAHGFHWGSELLFLACRNLPTVCEQIVPLGDTGTGGVYAVAYKRSPGCKVLAVSVEIAGITPGTIGYATVVVTASAGTVSWVRASGLDGTARLAAADVGADDYAITTGYLDVSQLTAGTVIDLKFTVVNNGSANGLYRLHVAEVPLATSDVLLSPTTEQGYDVATWPQRGRALYDGTFNGPSGFVRAVAALDSARVAPYRHVQACTLEQTTTSAWAVTSTTLAPVFSSGGTSVAFRFRPRDLYGDGTGEPFVPRVRYLTTTNTGSVRFTFTPVGGGTPATTTLALGAGAGIWKVATGSSVVVPVTGTGGEVDVTIDASTSALTAYLGQWALTQNAA